MNKIPPTWLLWLIAVLPQISETVYTPVLPDIAHALHVSESWAEYTLTAYLLGLGIGVLFWGCLSDRYGRKPCIIAGFLIFILGCVGCGQAESITALILSRWIQAFGGSVGSVLGQAICRDAFKGPALNHIYVTVGMGLSLSPALGPILGGFCGELWGWSSIFRILILWGIGVVLCISRYLPETHAVRSHTPIMPILKKMSRDPQVIAYGCLVSGVNGIIFSYFAEGPFFLIELLGLRPTHYGMTFWGISASYLGMGLYLRKYAPPRPQYVLQKGCVLMVISTALFSVSVFSEIPSLYPSMMILLTVIFMILIFAGGFCVTSYALSLALRSYTDCIGIASSLFGAFYYTTVSILTFFMASIHNDTLAPMPVYFLVLSLIMWGISSFLGKKIAV